MTIATDYEQLLEGWHPGPDSFTHAGAKSGETWKHCRRVAKDFGPEYITIRKVPTHKPFLAVIQGSITYRDWLGNRKADEMAKRGVMGHASNAVLVSRERDRIEKQQSLGKFIAWLNVQLRTNAMHLL